MGTTTFQIRPAERTSATPLIGLYGLSGTGKTMSALLLARGLVGPEGRIIMIDTESGRGQLYADVIEGGYEVIDLGEPFSPDRYIDAMKVAEEAAADVLIIDSGSHAWEGIGGVVDQAGEVEKRTGKPGLHCWREPKIVHQRFVLALLRTRMPVIVCLRAKHKSRQAKNPRTGKSEIVRDDHTTPIQAEDFIYELTVHAEVQQNHTLRVTKISHPGLADVFRDGQTISVETGQALAEWASQQDPPQRRDPFEAAASIAEQGVEAFRTWWKDQSKSARAVINGRLDELKAIAENADANGGPAPDDPWEGEDEGGTDAETDSPEGDSATAAAETEPSQEQAAVEGGPDDATQGDMLGAGDDAAEPVEEPPVIRLHQNPTKRECMAWRDELAKAIEDAPSSLWLNGLLARNEANISMFSKSYEADGAALSEAINAKFDGFSAEEAA